MLKCWIDTRLIYTSRGFTGFVHCTFQAFVTFTRTDAAHLSRTLEALRCTGFTPRFHSYPSLAVTGIGSGSRSHLSTKFALHLFAVSSLIVTLITSGSVFRADVEACLSLLLFPADLPYSSLVNIILVDFRSISHRIRPTVLQTLLGKSSRSLIFSPSSS